jgi:hypothetical protein
MFSFDETSAYLVKRYQEETAAANAATDRKARLLHFERAMKYAQLAIRAGGDQTANKPRPL